MCGRYTLRTPAQDLVALFDLAETPPEFPPRYNIAPTQNVVCVRSDPQQGGRRLAWMRWGLIPSWARDLAIGSRMINARAETVREKPSFRAAFKKRRCLLPADGYYEWQAAAGRKQPYLIGLPEGAPFAMAGLWECWEGGGEPLLSCTILTTDANPQARAVHDRMPVLVPPKDFSLWLDAPPEDAALVGLLRPWDGPLQITPVSTRVNSPRNEDPQCVAEITIDRTPT